MEEKEILSGLDEEEQKRLERIEKLDSNQKRKKLIFAGVTVFLVALFVFGTVFGGKYILSYEGSQPLPAEEYPEAVYAEKDVLPEVTKLIEETENYASVKLDSRFHVSVDADSLNVTGEEDGITEQLLRFVSGSVEEKLSGIYSADCHTGAYGEDFSAFLPEFGFSADDTEKAELTVNEENENELIATFAFPGCDYEELSGTPMYKIFALEDLESDIAEAEKGFASDLTVNDKSIVYDGFTITAYVSREMKNGEEKRELTRLVYARNCTVTLNVTFAGGLSEFGTKEISFGLACAEEYGFSRVSFRISTPVYFIEKGNSDEINRRVHSDEGVQDIKITWESSDPEILSVDEKGFYKGRKVSDKPVTVKGTYTYKDVEYTDECLFYVRVPAESVKLSEKAVTMKSGEELTLTPTVKPADATFRDVYWFTTDENVVTVENGVVKAVAPGEAGVYVITFDGNFKKTCTVTVEG